MSKIISFDKEARQKLLEGVEILAKAVVSTLSPKGRNVAIQRQWGAPIVVHDGVTVARSVSEHDHQLKDHLVAVGINLVQQAAQRTNDQAGDGTTTATLIAYEVVRRGMKLIEEGVNPMVLREQIEEAMPLLIAEISKISQPVKDKAQLFEVATISSADKEIGEMVSEAVDKMGKDGMVTVEEGNKQNTEVEYTDGVEIDNGYIHPYFVTNPNRMEAVVDSPTILLYMKKLSVIADVAPTIEKLVSMGKKDILIVCEDMTGDALATLIVNKQKGNINILVCKAPKVDRQDYMEDLAVLVGGKVISEKQSVDMDVEAVGTADKVIAGRDTTTIIKGGGDKEEIEARMDYLRTQSKNEKNEFIGEKLEKRLAKMTAGIAVIRVGAKMEVDMRERVERVKDAIGAATAARDEGIVPGGGTAFLMLRKALKPNVNEGQRLLYDVLSAPIRKIMENCGESTRNINRLIAEIEAKNDGIGYEVYSGSLENMKEKGVIDPAKVIRLALVNGTTVATSILTTDTIISIQEDKTADAKKDN